MRLQYWALVSLLAITTTHAEPLPAGRGRMEFQYGGAPLTLFTYKPVGYKDGPLVIVFHGGSRNAEPYRDYAVPLADRLGVMLVAPLLDTTRFPAEEWGQRGGILDADGKARPREQWLYNVVPAIVAEVRARERRPEMPYHLLGHSAGAQFLVRLAAFMPGEARNIVAGNAGALLFPSRDHAFGYGFGGLPSELADDAMLRRFLAAPLTLYLGTSDTGNPKQFDTNEAALTKQGPHRLGRNRAFFELGRKLAQERSWTFNWRKVEAPGVGHDGAGMFAAPELEDALLGRR